MKRCALLLALAGAAAAGLDTARGQDGRPPVGVQSVTIEAGTGQQSAALPGAVLTVFTYRPKSCTPRLLLVVFHGVGRDAGPYRDHARTLADRLCAVVIAPEFDRERFPTILYQYGGVVKDHVLAQPGNRTVDLVSPLVAWARAAVGQPDLPYVLAGHSAGAQFLARVAAYASTTAVRIVIANPSTWVLPSTKEAAPFGFSDIGTPEASEQALRAYLALPITVLLGGMDTGTHNLTITPQAMAQGPNRLSRGHNTFLMAQTAARSHSWQFGWHLVEIPGVGHDATAMFSASKTVESLMAVGIPP
jgi:acetyl esterase/lipase